MERYIDEVKKHLAGNVATEHTYRSALERLVEGLGKNVTATNEPKRIRCGAPDFIVTTGEVPLGYIEAKDVGTSLDKEETSEQLERYLPSLANLILTDYIEFRWYVNGEARPAARLGDTDAKGNLYVSEGGPKAVESLLTAFLNADVPTVSSPKELAIRMAAIARLTRDTIERALAEEKESGPLHVQMKGFKEVLLHDLTEKKFADMYAQTICYGLFAARANSDSNKRFTREHAAYLLPKTNPFLRQMFGHIAGPELAESIVWAVDDVAELLHRADMTAILRDFGRRTKRQDPVLHFYETFLAEYDPALRERAGVYFTPEPVVDYIVHSIDNVLRKSFGLKGLADSTKINIKNPHGKGTLEVHKVLLLDPATGTGTFLHGIIDHIRDTIVANNKGMWSSYVSSHLLPRLFGFELLMAPYAVAHMKLGLQLSEMGYDFAANERLRVYLTNTLEEAHAFSKLSLFSQWIAEEANAANAVKQDAPVMVILGNPPYSGHSTNSGKWITELIEDYKKIDGKKIRLGQGKWLQNDYVKFLRFAQNRIEQTGYGVLAMITDHSYIDSGTFVGMRANLQAFFDDIYVLDLHGNAKRNKNRTDLDQNVFDITQGVAIIV
ncbi:MAG: N-6 DNA methylase, partial [Gemmatimonadota bacterium]|nr:N-6 DNA methylase [Gemmatimonadota bacterium]